MDDIDAFLEEKTDDIDAFLDEAPADSSIPSPIAAAADGFQRLNQGITDTAVAAAKPVAAPIDAAIKSVDDKMDFPKIATVKHTSEGDIQGDLFTDLISMASGKIASELSDTVLSGTPELAKRGVKDFVSGQVGLGSGIGGGLSTIGFENIGSLMAKSAEETAKNLMAPDPNIIDKIAQGLGSMSAFMVPGLGIARGATAVATVAPRLAMFLGMTTSSVLEAGVEAGDVYNRVMDKTGDKTEANVAAGRAFFANLPLIQYTNKLGWAGDQAGRVARALESFFTEGFQEGGQEFISNLTAHDPLMNGVVEAAFVGGIVGGVAGAAVHGPVNTIRHPSETPPGAPPAAPAPAPAPRADGTDPPAPVSLNTDPIAPDSVTLEVEEPLTVPLPTPAEVAALPDESKIAGEVYHGSPEKVLEGGVLKVGTEGLPVDGIFFSASKDEAAKYAKDGAVHAANVTIENPANDKILRKVRKGRNGAETRAELIRLGYDGVISEKMGDIIAFNQDQVKLVETNAAPAEPVENVVAQLEKAGYEPKTARTLGVVFEGFRVLGDRAGIAAHKLFDRYGIKIVKGEKQVKGEGKVLEQGAPTAPTFYSKFQKDIEAKLPEKATVEQVGAILRETKEEERKWSGVDEFMKDKEKVSKAELLDFLRANQLQIEEVEKGGENGPEVAAKARVKIDDIEREFKNHGYDLSHADSENVGELDLYKGDKRINQSDLPAEQKARLNEYEDAHRIVAAAESGDALDGTKFGQYTLPGGKNYRELLLTLPGENKKTQDHIDRLQEEINAARSNRDFYPAGSEPYNKFQAEIDRIYKLGNGLIDKEKAPEFRSSHFDEPNILAHVRFNDRSEMVPGFKVKNAISGNEGPWMGTRAEAEAYQKTIPSKTRIVEAEKPRRVLFIEEIQSDWHQKGRREGYAGDYVPLSIEEKREYHSLVDRGRKDRTEEENSRVEELGQRIAREQRGGKGVPDAPFKKTWHEFALKRMVRYAAENGYDKIAWTTGEQQAERYDLSRVAESVNWYLREDGQYRITADTKDRGVAIREVIVSEEKLPDLVGKDVAARIINGVGQREIEADESDYKKVGKLRGLDLKVGGEGMSGFYDKIVPAYMGKLGKKFGAKVENIRFPHYVVDHGRGSESSTPGREHDLELAERNARSNSAKVKDKSIVAHSMTITPELKRAAVGEGFPLFQGSADGGSPRGRLRIQGRQFTIELLEDADLSTFLHEAGHLYLEVLGDIAADPAASEQIKGDYATILAWFGVKSREEIAVEHHEQFARGFEAYLMEGKAPSQQLRSAFESFKEWLGAIYKQLSALDVNLTPEVRRVFDRMLASDADLNVELQAAEKALDDARKRKNAADSQAPPESPQDALPAAKAAVLEEETRVKKAKAKAQPVPEQAKPKPGDGARILGVKRSVLESFQEIGALIESNEPMTQLKPAKLEKFANAGLLDTSFRVTDLARKAVAEMKRLKGLMTTGYLENIAVSEPSKITLKSFFRDIIKRGKFGLLKTYEEGWITDGRIMFRTAKEDAPVYATFKHMGEKFTNPVNLDPVIEGAMRATDQVTGVLGVHEVTNGEMVSYLLQTEGGRQVLVAANYYNFFKDRYPDAQFYAQGEGQPIKVEQGGQMVAVLMPMRGDLKYTVYAMDGTAKTVEASKGRLEVDAKVIEANKARAQIDFAKKVHAENAKEIRQLDETPGEKTAALITKIAGIQKENLDLESQMADLGQSLAVLEEQAAALREQHGISDIPVSGLVKKSRPKGGKGGGKGASSGDFAYDTPVELGGMEHIKPFRMPEMVRLAYELMGKVPEVGGLRRYHGYFKGVGGGEIKLNPLIFLKPEQAAKTLAHEIGHLIDYLPDHTLKRGNLIGSLKSLHSHLANTFGTLQITNKDLRDELMAVTNYWRPWDQDASTDSYKAYRKSARELYADAISMLFNSPGTLERMAPKFYAGFFEALDAKPAVKLAFFELQALLNAPEMNIQESRHLDRKAMYLKAEDLWALKRKEQEARESHYAEWFKQLVVDKHQKAIGLVEAAVSKGDMLSPSADPRYILEEMSLADNANHAFLEEVDAKVVRLLNDSEATILDLGDYLYLSRVAQGDRQAFANPKGYNPDEAGKAIDYMKTRLGSERFAKLEAAAAAFREIVYTLSEEAVSVGAYSQQVFDEKIKPNRGSYAVFAVQEHLEDYIAAGVKEQVGTLKDIANPFTATVMKMVALNRLIAKQKGANAMRDFLLPRGEAEKAEAINPQETLVQFRKRKDKGMLELLENGHRAAYYVDPYIAEAFQKKEAGTFQLAVKILDSVFNGVFRPLYITFNIGFQLYSNPIRDFARTRRNVYALVKNEGYAGTVKSLILSYFDSLSPAAKRAMDIPDALVSEMIANKSLDITFTDFSFDPDADQYTAVMRKMGVAPPQQNGIIDKMSKTKILYPLARFLEGIRFIGNAHETASKIAGYKVLKADQLKTLDAAIREEKDETTKKFLVEQRKLLEKGEGEYAHQLAYNTRNYVGTPNWRRRGTISHITNTLFPFSNIMVQGFRSDLDIATSPATRTGFMFDMVLTHVLPKLLMFMAALGGAGDDLEEFFTKVSEYDKSNYMVIPMGWSYGEKGGRKAVYWRVPHDESGRLIAAVAWKVLTAMRGDPKSLQQIVDMGAGQLPKLAPPITIGATWVAYLSGKNPYDDFRGRPLMPDKVHQAGGRYALTSMVKWTVNQMGLASFATHDPSGKSSVESALQVTPLLNRIIKISDYGEREESMKKISEKQAEDAALSLDRGAAAVSYTKERYILSQKLAADEISTDERVRLSRLNKYYPVYLTYSRAIKRANEKGDEDKMEYYRDRLDGILAKVVD